MSRASHFRAAEALRAEPAADGTPDLRELVRLGTLAANSHNTQPWRFELGQDRIRLRPDPARRCPVVDPEDAHLWRSLGCAAENIVQGAQDQALAAEVAVQDGAVEIRLRPKPAAPPDPLFAAVVRRQCCKAPYDGAPLTAADVAALFDAGRVAGARAEVITDTAQKAGIADLVAEGNRAQMADPAFRAELIEWMRFNDRTAIARGDGLAGRVLGLPSVPDWLGRRIVGLFLSADRQAKADRRLIDTSPALAVIVVPGDGPAPWVDAGRAGQRLQLQATALGLASAFLNQPIEVPALRPRLEALLCLDAPERAHLLLRLGRGPRQPYSLRRRLAEVIDPG